MNPYGDIDLTSYLQIEGRRRAAELDKAQSQLQAAAQTKACVKADKKAAPEQDASAQKKTVAASSKPAKLLEPGQTTQQAQQQQQQQSQAGSLNEVLRQMGVV